MKTKISLTGDCAVGSGRVLIIAEAGVNHNGSLDMALEMVDAASDAGADMIKFQTFKPELGVSKNASKAEYQKTTTGEEESQLDMVRKYELSRNDHTAIMERCKNRGIEFFSTPFDLDSVDMLVSLGLERLKIPSGEITNWPLIHKIGASGRPVIMSTGMSTLEEIRLAMGVYLLGALETNTVPDEYESERVFVSEKGQSHLKNNMILLHCTTQYPAPYEDVNLLAMELLADEFGLPVGYSDHTEGIAVSIAAAAMGAVVIEKHFTLDKNLPGPDHKASVSPGELKDLVENVKKTKLALGKRVKFVSPSESSNICIARKSLTALTDIKKGELFTWQNLGTKRPGTGVSPAQFWKYLGRPADREYQEDDQL